jgi:valyl-tRNA synthetase
MTITPWHSMVDFEIAQRHNLEKEQIIDTYGKLLPIAQEFAGMKIAEAREKIVEKLKTKGLLEKEEDYTHNVATAERTGGIIEPQIMKQWFINVTKPIVSKNNQTLKDLMSLPIQNNEISIMPDRFDKIYQNWVTNLRDWCISRQIVYGHRIPVWYKGEEIYCGIDTPTGEGWIQDEDSLDTWFSSGLWTFSTLGWPEETKDLQEYHPTTFMNPGYEIIFFWVARMVMMSNYLLGVIPFKTVYLHGMVRDKNGVKFSKSLKNGIAPEEIIRQYGADALRMSLITGVGPGSDVNFSEDKVRAYKKFTNKIWNATRFVLEQTSHTDLEKPVQLSSQDQTSLDDFHTLLAEITKEIEEYKLYLVSEKLYHYFWHTFADIIIEDCKKRITTPVSDEDKKSAQHLLRYLLINQLKVLHPFMPFITEEIWQTIHKDNTMLIVSPWPQQ